MEPERNQTQALKPITTGTPATVHTLAEVSDLIAAWHVSLDRLVAAGDLARTTRNTYAIGAAKFTAWAETQAIGQVTSDTIREWIASLRSAGKKAGSINTWLAGLRAFYSWALGAGRMWIDPTAGVKGDKRAGTKQKHKRQALTDREVMRVLSKPDTSTATGTRDKAIVSIMAYTAARTIEVYRADLADLKSEGGQLVLYVQGKGHDDKDELIVIDNPQAAGALHDWLSTRGDRPGPLFLSQSDRSNGDRLSLRAIREIIKGYYKAAGVVGKDKTTHSLRHAAISNAIRHGAPVQKVQAMARHASIETTMIYYHEVDRLSDPAERYISYNGTDEKGHA